LAKKRTVRYESRWYIVDRLHMLKICWDTFVDALILFSVISTFYFLGFGAAEGGWLVINHLVRGFFVIDLVLCFLTTTVDETGEEV
jgi:hypothetical protein